MLNRCPLIFRVHNYFCADSKTKEFGSWTEFLAWKEAEEEGTFTHFIKPTGAKLSDSGKFLGCSIT